MTQSTSCIQIVCRTLGFAGGVALTDLEFGAGLGNIWMDDVQCGGDESRIEDCPRRPYGENNCGHNEDAAVRCREYGSMLT